MRWRFTAFPARCSCSFFFGKVFLVHIACPYIIRAAISRSLIASTIFVFFCQLFDISSFAHPFQGSVERTFMALSTIDHAIIDRWSFNDCGFISPPIQSDMSRVQDLPLAPSCSYSTCLSVAIAITALGNISWKFLTQFSFDIQQMASPTMSIPRLVEMMQCLVSFYALTAVAVSVAAHQSV